MLSRTFTHSALNTWKITRSAITKSIRTPAKARLSYSNNSTIRRPRIRTRHVVLSGLAAAAFFAAVNEDFRNATVHTAKMADRIGVVAITTSRCFLKYKLALSKTYDSEAQRQEALSKCHSECAYLTYLALAHNGGVYIKLGQHLTALTYILPPEWPEAMLPLQDHCPESTLEEIDEMFFSDLGLKRTDILESFDPIPIGVASLAQVHTAITKDGQKVAVKCQHPSLKEFVPLDISLTRAVFKALATCFPEYDLQWLGDELQNGIFIELDFRIEEQNANNTREYFSKYKKLTSLRVPEIKWATKRILIMEYLPGHRLDDSEYLDEYNISRAQVSSCLAHIFNNMIFTPGVGIHCDPHGGNLAIRHVDDGARNFEIILYDHGQYRQVSTQMRRAYARMWLAFLDSDKQSIKKYAQEFCGISDEDFPLFAAAITGRDTEHALNDIQSSRTKEEIERMTTKIQEDDLLPALMKMLASLPSIVLLIFKTNDLVRNLDERLKNPLGPEKGFLIMAWYCERTVFEEEKEGLGSGVCYFWGYLKALWKYEKRAIQLMTYDIVFSFKRSLGY